jgi:hypothetical protein
MNGTRRMRLYGRELILTLLLVVGCEVALSQDNYVVQVYDSETVPPKTTVIGLHSVLIADGTKSTSGPIYTADQLYPTNDALHETPAITQGITGWSEVSFYVFTSARSGQGWQWVGDHIRPQVRAPENWHWPVGGGLSIDFGYQRPGYSADTWTLAITPIVDKQIGRWYFALNPSFVRSLHGRNVSQGFEFAPSFKLTFGFNKYISGGLEYYSKYGALADVYSFHNQQQEFFPTIDLNLSPDWDVNCGVGIGVTANTDDWIFKANVRRRFDWTHRHTASAASMR